eukprot:460813-Amphidinium_carterae.1
MFGDMLGDEGRARSSLIRCWSFFSSFTLYAKLNLIAAILSMPGGIELQRMRTSEPNNVEGDLGGTCPSLVSSTT